MGLFKIRVVHLEGKSLIVVDGQVYRLGADLRPTDSRDEAIEVIIDKLLDLYNGEEEESIDYQLDSCKFGHLTLPSMLIHIDLAEVSIAFDCFDSKDKRERNQYESNRLIELVLVSNDGTSHLAYARSSITDVVDASFCSFADFVSAFDWILAESISLRLYLEAILN